VSVELGVFHNAVVPHERSECRDLRCVTRGQV
jgi:hypothetical protein